jgi:hypothetical protein
MMKVRIYKNEGVFELGVGKDVNTVTIHVDNVKCLEREEEREREREKEKENERRKGREGWGKGRKGGRGEERERGEGERDGRKRIKK